MSNTTWVCFDCKSAVRKDTFFLGDVVCAKCGKLCVCLGRKIPVPPKNKTREWKKLHDVVIAQYQEAAEQTSRQKVRQRHAIERAIVAAEFGKKTNETARILRQLRERLAKL